MAKLLVLEAVVRIDLVWLAVVAVAFSIIGAFYYLRMVKLIYFDKPDADMPVLTTSGGVRFAMSLNGLSSLLAFPRYLSGNPLELVPKPEPSPIGSGCVGAFSRTKIRVLPWRSRHMFRGSIVALITPMHEDGGIDDASLRRLVDFHVDAGTTAIVAVGTTGESATLDEEEHCAVIRRTSSSPQGGFRSSRARAPTRPARRSP
jgi:hypothetical protein